MATPRFVRSPYTGAAGTVASAVWEGFWLIGPPVGVSVEDRRWYLFWGLIALVACGTQAFVALVRENAGLKALMEPRARLAFDETERTVFVQDGTVAGKSPQVIFRVGVVNLSAVQIEGLRVVFESAQPHEQHVTYPNSPLKVHRDSANENGVFTLNVGDGVTPGVYVEVLEEMHFPRYLSSGQDGEPIMTFDGTTPLIRVRYASHTLCDPTFHRDFRAMTTFPKELLLRLEGNIPVSRLCLRVKQMPDGHFAVTTVTP
jgi:hypothetical protein